MTTGRFRSFSQSVFLLGPRTITGLLHLMPSLLSTSAMLFLGRQENHIRKVSPSLRTPMSKQVPRLPPRTGFFGCFTQPAVVSAWPPTWIDAQRSSPKTGNAINVFILASILFGGILWAAHSFGEELF